MLPADRSETGPVTVFQATLRKLRFWVREEIVADDPWDVTTLFPEPETQAVSESELTAQRSVASGAATSVSGSDPTNSSH